MKKYFDRCDQLKREITKLNKGDAYNYEITNK